MTTTAAPRRTPLDAVHRRLGARLIEFAGYEMPVRYTSELEEHRSVRQAVGLVAELHVARDKHGPLRVRRARPGTAVSTSTIWPTNSLSGRACATSIARWKWQCS